MHSYNPNKLAYHDICLIDWRKRKYVNLNILWNGKNNRICPLLHKFLSMGSLYTISYCVIWVYHNLRIPLLHVLLLLNMSFRVLITAQSSVVLCLCRNLIRCRTSARASYFQTHTYQIIPILFSFLTTYTKHNIY